jgi:hypothetical protein
MGMIDMVSISTILKRRYGSPPKDRGIFFAQDQWHSYFQGDCPGCGQYQELEGSAHKDLFCPGCGLLLISSEEL